MESLFLLYSALTMIHWPVRVVKGRTKERTDTVSGEIFKYNFDGQSRTSILDFNERHRPGGDKLTNLFNELVQLNARTRINMQLQKWGLC